MKPSIVCLSLISVLILIKSDSHAQEGVTPTRAIGFVHSPRLLGSNATSSNVNAPATYHFTIALPADAGVPLQKITVTQVNSEPMIRFHSQRTQVFVRQQGRFTTVLPSQTIVEQNTLSVILNPAAAPGTTLTLALRPVRNPDNEGTYLFGVTAFPAGDNVDSQFLGFGRFQFQRSDGAD